MPKNTPGSQLKTILDRIEALVSHLKEEPWDEYNKTLVAASTILARKAMDSLQTIAKAISRITPEESRQGPEEEPWYHKTLDEMK